MSFPFHPAVTEPGEPERCHVCGHVGQTILLHLRGRKGPMIGRTCPQCRTCRRAHPWASPTDYEAATQTQTEAANKGGDGVSHADACPR